MSADHDSRFTLDEWGFLVLWLFSDPSGGGEQGGIPSWSFLLINTPKLGEPHSSGSNPPPGVCETLRSLGTGLPRVSTWRYV